jgi:hypothetical protein
VLHLLFNLEVGVDVVVCLKAPDVVVLLVDAVYRGEAYVLFVKPGQDFHDAHCGISTNKYELERVL